MCRLLDGRAFEQMLQQVLALGGRRRVSETLTLERVRQEKGDIEGLL